jgi:PRTRC genetic system protein E
MFNELLPILEKRSLVLTLAALPDKRIRVTVTPRPKSDEDKKAVIVPLAVEGTPEELNADFAKAISDYSAHSLSFENSIAEVKATMEAELKQIKDDAAKKVTDAKKTNKVSRTSKPASKTEATKPEPKKEPEPSPVPSLFDIPGVTDNSAPADQTTTEPTESTDPEEEDNDGTESDAA